MAAVQCQNLGRGAEVGLIIPKCDSYGVHQFSLLAKSEARKMVWELGRCKPEPSPGPRCCFPDAGTRMHSAFLETDESLPDGGRALKKKQTLP